MMLRGKNTHTLYSKDKHAKCQELFPAINRTSHSTLDDAQFYIVIVSRNKEVSLHAF